MTQIHGHRGFRGRYPENSIKGFIAAKKYKLDAIELDLVVSKDLQLIVNHDPWLKSGNYMINKTGEVPDYDVNLFTKTIDEIRQFILGTKRNLSFPEQMISPHSIPTFKECVSHPALQNTFWNIEIKSEEQWYDEFQPQPKELAKLIHDFINKYQLNVRCLVQSFDFNFLNELKKLDAKYPLGFLIENKEGFDSNMRRLDFKPAYYNPDEVLVTQELVDKIHASGMQCLIWTVNNKERAQEFIAYDVDGLITDYPDKIQSILQ